VRKFATKPPSPPVSVAGLGLIDPHTPIIFHNAAVAASVTTLYCVSERRSASLLWLRPEHLLAIT
jgi:hypothetical protein